MALRDRILVVLLWMSVLMMATWVGGTLFNMLVVVPMWNASPPDTIRSFFGGTDFNRTIYNFFGPPWMIARNVPKVLALAFAWHRPRHRTALLASIACTTVFGLVITLGYVYPINEVLFHQAGGDGTADEIRALGARWIFADRVRFAVALVGFVALLWAFRQPITSGASRGEQ